MQANRSAMARPAASLSCVVGDMYSAKASISALSWSVARIAGCGMYFIQGYISFSDKDGDRLHCLDTSRLRPLYSADPGVRFRFLPGDGKATFCKFRCRVRCCLCSRRCSILEGTTIGSLLKPLPYTRDIIVARLASR